MAEDTNLPDNNQDIYSEALAKKNFEMGRPLDYNPLDHLKTTATPIISPFPADPIMYNQDYVGNELTGPNPNIYKTDEQNPGAILSTKDLARNNSRGIKNSFEQAVDPNLFAIPYSFNGRSDGARFERYYNHPKFTSLGFNPYDNNEDLYNKYSTFGNEFSRASGQWGKLIWSGISAGIGSWFDGGGLRVKNDLKTAMEMNEAMDIGSSSKGGLGGWAINTFTNSGYSIGVGMEWVAEEFLLTTAIGLSGGALAPELLPAMGARGVRAAGLLGKNYSRGKNLGAQLKMLNNVQEAKTFWNATRTGKFLKGAGTIINPLGNTMASLKGIRYANKEYAALHALNTFGGFARDWIQMKAAVTESNLEGGLVKLDIQEKLIEQYRKDNNGKYPLGEDMKKIVETADANGLTTSWTNIPVIYMSNSFLHETLFKFLKPRYTAGIGTGEVLSKEAAGVVTLEKSGFKLYDTRLGRIKASTKALLKPRTHFKYMGAYMKANIAEGLQENVQEAISEGALAHAMDLYNNDYRYANESFTSHVMDGLKNQLSARGFETFASGFVMGAISQPVISAPFSTLRWANDLTFNRKSAQEYKAARNKQLKEVVDKLNNNFKDTLKFFAPEFRNLGAQGKLSADYLEALANGDVKGQMDAKRMAEAESVMNALYSGGYDALLNKFKEGYLQLSDQDLIDAFNKDRTEGDKLFTLQDAAALKAQINGIVSRAEKIKQRFDWVGENLNNPYNYNLYPAGTEAHEAMKEAYVGWREMQKAVILGYASYDSNLNRIKGIYEDLGSSFEKIRAYDVNLLLSPEARRKEIVTLDSEIEVLEQNTDAESKKQLKFKKELREKLGNFDTLFQVAEMTQLYDEEGIKSITERLKSQGVTLIKSSKEAKRDEDNFYANGNVVILKTDEDKNAYTIIGVDKSDGSYEVARIYQDEEGNVQVDEDSVQFVSEDEFDILSEQYIAEAHRISHTSAMKDAFMEYIKLFANENQELVTNDKIEKAFQGVIDYILLNKENINLMKNLNYITDPVHMAELAARFMKAYNSNKQKMLRQMIAKINKEIQKFEWNAGLRTLYQKGFWISETDLDRITKEAKANKPLSDPETFIDVATGETLTKDSDKYKKALAIWTAQKEIIGDSFRNYVKTEALKKHKIVENADKTFSVISPEGNPVGTPFATREEAEKIASELDAALAEEERKKQEPPTPKRISIAAGDTDWWDKYNDDPEVLKLKDALLTRLSDLTGVAKEDISPEDIQNFLKESTTAASIINAWNAAREKAKVGVPELKATQAPKDLSQMTIADLEKFVSSLEDIKDKTPDLIADIKALKDYIGKRKGLALVKPTTKEQAEAVDKLKGVQADIANKTDEGKNYIILGNLYDRVTNIVPKMVLDIFGYSKVKNADGTYSILNYKGEVQGESFEAYTDENGKLITAEENAQREVDALNKKLTYSKFTETNSAALTEITSAVEDLTNKINSKELTKEQAIEKLFETLLANPNNIKNDNLFYLFNDRKIAAMKSLMKDRDFTIDAISQIFNDYSIEHTSLRGTRVDNHIRDFFTNFELGERPTYFTEEAWEGLKNILEEIRNNLVSKGFNVIANDLTVFDEESKVAGTLDLLIIDNKGNYYIYDIKTGSKRKWENYEKSDGLLPHSGAMVENTLQLSLYSNLLNNNTGIEAKGLGIFGIETTEDLDGNILSVVPVNKNKSIPIKYDLGISPSPSQAIVPLKSFEKAPAKDTSMPESKEVTSVAEVSQNHVSYLQNYLKGLQKKLGEYGKTIDTIDSKIVAQNEKIAQIKKDQEDLTMFLERASEKELKGKKKKIKAQIKELEDSLKETEDGLALLKQQRIDTIAANSKLEKLVYITKDALQSVIAGEIRTDFKMQEYITETLANLKDKYLNMLVALDDRIQITQDTISKVRDTLKLMGVIDDIIDAELAGIDTVPYLRTRINEIKKKYFDTTEAKKIDRYRGRIQEEYQTEIAPYLNLLQKLTKKESKDFRSAYREAVRTLRGETNTLTKLKADYEAFYKMEESLNDPFYFDVREKNELLTSIAYLEEALSLIEKANKEKVAKEKPAEKPAPKKPVAPVTKPVKKEGVKSIIINRVEFQFELDENDNVINIKDKEGFKVDRTKGDNLEQNIKEAYNKQAKRVEPEAEPISIDKEVESLKNELVGRKFKTLKGVEFTITNVTSTPSGDAINITYSNGDIVRITTLEEFDKFIKNGKILIIEEEVEKATAPSTDQINLSQIQIDSIESGKIKLLDFSEAEAVPTGEKTVAIIQDKNKESSPTNKKIKITNIGFIKIIDRAVGADIILTGNHVGELRKNDIDASYDDETETTVISGDEYAAALGYEDWAQYEIENKELVDKIQSGKSKRVLLLPEVPGAKPKARLSKAESSILRSEGITLEVENLMTDEEIKLTLEAIDNEDSEYVDSIIEKYIGAILPESVRFQDVIGNLEVIFRNASDPTSSVTINELEKEYNLIESLIENNPLYITGDNALQEVESYYNEKLESLKTNPLKKNIDRGATVIISDQEYIAEKISANSITFALLSDPTVKEVIKDNEIPTKVQRIEGVLAKVSFKPVEISREDESKVINSIQNQKSTNPMDMASRLSALKKEGGKPSSESDYERTC